MCIQHVRLLCLIHTPIYTYLFLLVYTVYYSINNNKTAQLTNQLPTTFFKCIFLKRKPNNILQVWETWALNRSKDRPPVRDQREAPEPDSGLNVFLINSRIESAQADPNPKRGNATEAGENDRGGGGVMWDCVCERERDPNLHPAATLTLTLTRIIVLLPSRLPRCPPRLARARPYPVSSCLPARATPPRPLAPPPVNPPTRHATTRSRPFTLSARARASGRSVWVASPCGRWSLGAGAGRVTVPGRRSFCWLVGPRRRWRRSAAERRSPSRSSSPSPSSAPASCSTASSTRYNLPLSRHRQIRAGFREISGLPGFAPVPQYSPSRVATRARGQLLVASS